MTPSTELTVREKTQKAIDQLRSPEITTGIEEALPHGVSLQQFQRVAANALIDNEKLVDADRRSLVQSVIKCAADGLLPDGRDAALVIYRTKQGNEYIQKVQYIPMIGGLRRVAAEHGWSLFTSVVHENDQFDPDPENHHTGHKPTRLGTDPGPVIGAYAIAEHRDGRKFGPEIMDVNAINDVRNKASRAKDGEAWTKWWNQMAEKTVGRRLWKKLPFDSKDRERIARLIDADDMNGDDAADALYGTDFDPQTGEVFEPIPDEADDGPEDEPEEGDWEDGSAEDAPGGEQPAFEGDEPPVTTPAITLTATFGSGRYAGKTVQEIWDLGDEGHAYIKWAISKWKTGDIVNDLHNFAATHQEELA